MSTPEWLLTAEPGLCPCGCIGKRRKGSFVEKTLSGGAGLLRQVLYSEDLADRDGFLQRLDARVKIAGVLVLLVAAALLHTIPALILVYAALLVLAAASALPLGFFIKRVWLFVPIFTGIVLLPATFSFVTPGNIVLPLWHWDGHPVGITSQGLTSAGLVISRVAVSISLVVLLSTTTSWSRLLAALRTFGLPRMIILVVGMAYRYLFHLLSSVIDMYQARKARSLGKAKHDNAARAFVAAGAGALIGKSYHLSEEVHQAMTARGYRGDAIALRPFRLRAADLYCLAVAVVFGVLVVGGDRILGH